jgi:hypothetical protein
VAVNGRNAIATAISKSLPPFVLPEIDPVAPAAAWNLLKPTAVRSNPLLIQMYDPQPEGPVQVTGLKKSKNPETSSSLLTLVLNEPIVTDEFPISLLAELAPSVSVLMFVLL